jgi:Secretion system C-terminal sorting domain
MHFKQVLSCALLLVVSTCARSQSLSRSVLFLGNSYTYVNDLPQLTADVADAMGDTLIFASSTPGGYTFQQHTSNATSTQLIAQGTWDFVVLQEQSQMPSFPDGQVESDCFPYAAELDQMINTANPCTETVFYMTWGRKNGDASNCASWPPVCTYEGMDSLLNLRYRMMAETNHALVSPVGQVWHVLRTTHPEIELYAADASHPSLAGSYAGACTFYAILYRKNPIDITYTAGLAVDVAANIRSAVHQVVFGDLAEWHVGEYDPHASFTYAAQSNGDVTFQNASTNATTYHWTFGTNGISDEQQPTISGLSGAVPVTLIALDDCGNSDTLTMTIDVATDIKIVEETHGISFYPNPAHDFLTIKLSDAAFTSAVCFDALGKKIWQGQIKQNTIVDVSSWSIGLYTWSFYDAHGKHSSQQFIKQ